MKPGALLLLAGLGALVLASNANAADAGPSSVDPATGKTDAAQGDIPPNPDVASSWNFLDFVDLALGNGSSDGNVTGNNDLGYLMTGTYSASPLNLPAFLYMIRRCEQSASDVASGQDYYTFYGGSRFTNASDHPTITGEKAGVPLDSFGPAYAGLVSTAAGAYQITRTTWAGKKTANGYSGGVRDAGAWGPALPDFSPASQDEAARRILLQIGALPLIESGDIAGAIGKASARWASLPGSTAGQGGRDQGFALAAFNQALLG